jgi:Fic family protein
MRALESLWRREHALLSKQGAIRAFNERMARWWSIETGIIERLYDVSEGITLQLIEHGFEASLIPHGEATLDAEELVLILKDHRESLDFVMDVVKGQRSLSTSWIKELHALLTRHQDSTDALDAQGRRYKVALRRGVWKDRPSNPLTVDETVHEYCPPEHVASQMDELRRLYESLPPYPEVRSAWLHHAFTQIHPFQDGNGRVARALASIDFIKSDLFPVLVRREEREQYIQALRSADGGDLKPLISYFAQAQQFLIRKALNVSAQVVDGEVSLENVLAAASQRLKSRQGGANEAREQLAQRFDGLLAAAQRLFEETAQKVRERVVQLKNVDVHLPRKTDERRWFRSQLVHLGQRHGHWVDLNGYRNGVRLRLMDGGMTDIVVACHFIGTSSLGAGVAVLFMEHREAKEKSIDGPPLELAMTPLLLTAEEEQSAQQERFLAWLERERTLALAHWTRFL